MGYRNVYDAPAMLAVGGALFSQMPAQMASHWNAAGEVDGVFSKFWRVFLFPIMSIGLLGLFLIVLRIDPLTANLQKLNSYYYGLIVVFLVYFLCVYILWLPWNLDLRFDMTRVLMPAIAVLFLLMGLMMLKAKRNFFIVVRIPWTLSSDEAWDRTNKLGGRLLIVVGMITGIFAVVLAEIAIWVMLGMVLATDIFSIVGSYAIFYKLEKEGKIKLVSPTTRK